MLRTLKRLLRHPGTPTHPIVPDPSPPVPQSPPAFQKALEVLGPCGLTVVDVGARWGAGGDWFRLKPLARLIGFEPDRSECDRLNQQVQDGTEVFVPTALGRHDGSVTLYLTVEPACSSLFPPKTALTERFPSLRPLMVPAGTKTIPVARLATWAQQAGVERVDFIKLDTQGSELNILEGAGQLLDDCLGLQVEVMFSPMYEGQPLFAEVDAFLRSRGFVLWRLDSLAHYTDHPSNRLGRAATVHYEQTTVRHPMGDGQLVWADAIYFRDRDQVRHSPPALLRLAALLEAVGDLDASECCLHLLPENQACANPSAEPSPALADADAYIRQLPFDDLTKRRLRMTSGCTDCHSLPKVRGAGQVFAGPTGRYQLMHNGLKVVEDGYCGRWMTELIRLLRGHHEPQEERVFHDLTPHFRPGGVMVELGSFWAYYSLWFLRAVPEGRAVLVEPDPNNLRIGQANFALNDVRGEFLQASVGRCATEPQPFLCESDRQSRLLPQTSVDDLMQKLGIARVELLLADIQGAEWEMLQGATQAIDQGRLRFVFVSTHHHSISGDPLTHQKCLAFLRAKGGHVLAEHNVTEAFSGDGLIVASFDPLDRALAPIPLSRNYPTNSLFPELEYDVDRAWQALRERDR